MEEKPRSPTREGEKPRSPQSLSLYLPPTCASLPPLLSLSPVDGGENPGLEEMVAVEAVVLVIMAAVAEVAAVAVLAPPLAGDPALLQSGEIYRSLCLTEQPDVGSGSGAHVAVAESAGSLAVTVASSLPPASRKGESGPGSCASTRIRHCRD